MTVKPENRSWPRENAKNTKKDGLIPKVEWRADFPPFQSLLRSSLCALCVLLRQSNFGVRVKKSLCLSSRSLRAGLTFGFAAALLTTLPLRAALTPAEINDFRNGIGNRVEAA